MSGKQFTGLVKLPNGDYVNPAYVTCIEVIGGTQWEKEIFTRLWVVANSGYGTKSIDFAGDRRNELAVLIEYKARGS